MAEPLLFRVAKLVDDFPEAAELWGAGDTDLEDTFSYLQSIVPDAEKRVLSDESDKDIEQWLEDLKDAFYEAEDLLEEWSIDVMPLRESPSKDEKLKQVIPSSSSPSEKPDLMLEMSARAKEIRKRIEAIAAEGTDLGLRECAVVVRVERRERLDAFVCDEEIIGREDAKSVILKFLLDSKTDDQIPVLSIWGDDGVGKTALARCLYVDDMVKKHFDLRIWVNSFRNLEGELRKIRGRETTEREDDVLRLQRYLLVFDDLRDEDPEQWGSLKSLLMGGARGSKILITTRDRSVAVCTSTFPSYRLAGLPIKSSFDLLMRMACLEEEETGNSIKVDIGRKIVQKCHGIPLAIRMIGSLLFCKKTEEEWLHLLRETSEFSKNLPRLSYIHLPCHLKQCFAFCSLFPRDWVIDKQLLMSLWIAEGFIQPIENGDWDMEDIAHDYFMDLLRRNFFQDCVKDELGNVTSCRMHHLVHDLARHVAGTEYGRIYHSWPYLEERAHHISWDSTLDFSQGDTYLHRAYRLRTFIKTSQRKSLRRETQMGEKTLHKLISSFMFLRALDLHDSGIEKLPSSICELKHLTFLDLSENEGIIRLPDSVTRLETLQVLKLNMCYKLIELPEDFRKLVNLRQLEISDCSALSHMPQGLGQLTLLHTLTDFLLPRNDSCPQNHSGLGELNKLSNLRGSLRIEVKGGE